MVVAGAIALPIRIMKNIVPFFSSPKFFDALSFSSKSFGPTVVTGVGTTVTIEPDRSIFRNYLPVVVGPGRTWW